MTPALFVGIFFGMVLMSAIDFVARKNDREQAFSRGYHLGRKVEVRGSE